MPGHTTVNSPKGIQSPLLSQAKVHNGTVYVSGNVGMDFVNNKMAEGNVADRTRQALKNIEIVLEEAGSNLNNILKMNVYLTDMANYAAMNEVYTKFIPDPKPARTCVCVKELPFKTDVEIECVAHLDDGNTNSKL